MRAAARTIMGAALTLLLLVSPTAAGWRDWLGIEPETGTNTSIFDGIEPPYLLLFAVLAIVIAWAMRRPEDLRRGIAEGFGRAVGSILGWTIAPSAIAAVGAVAGTVLLGSYTFATAAMIFAGIMIAFAAFYLVVMFNS